MATQPGGEADKLGNRYESLWTIAKLLDIIQDRYHSITLESLDSAEGKGVEFHLTDREGHRFYHSVKRQTTNNSWTIADLKRSGKNHRSVFGDLIEHIQRDKENKAYFISQSSANRLRAITEAARQSKSLTLFKSRLNDEETKGFKSLLEFSNSEDALISDLCRLHIVTITEPELRQQLADRIESYFFSDGGSPDPQVVQGRLADFVLDHLGQIIRRNQLIKYLEGLGIFRWGSQSMADKIEACNAKYFKDVELNLINENQITRPEAATTIDRLINGDDRKFLIRGKAGHGKSCLAAQILVGLLKRDIPALALRLDELEKASDTPETFAQGKGLPASHVSTLARYTGERPSVLLVDQLDAISFFSGRSKFRGFFASVLDEWKLHKNMRLVLVCRTCDIEHDPSLRRMVSEKPDPRYVEMRPFSRQVVKEALHSASRSTKDLSEKQWKLLSDPLLLHLFLQIEETPFVNEHELFEKFWDYKYREVENRVGGESDWYKALITLASHLSKNQTLSARQEILGPYQKTREALISEHVLLLIEKKIRFFHERFFDYVYARQFVTGGKYISSFLKSSEQHLFRRAQVRQILNYERDYDFDHYLQNLKALLGDTQIRFHLKKVVLQWLSSLDRPTFDEWDILHNLIEWKELQNHIHLAIWKPPWFDLLNDHGLWSKWLHQPDEMLINRVFHGLNALKQERSKEVAELVAEFADDPAWKDRLLLLMRSGEIYHSREMMNLFLALIRNGVMDNARPEIAVNDDFWSYLYRMSEKKPSYAIEALCERWDRAQILAKKASYKNLFETFERNSQFCSEVLKRMANKAPLDFVESILPRVTTLLCEHSYPVNDGAMADRIWCRSNHSDPHSFQDQIFHYLAHALVLLAQNNPDYLDTAMNGMINSKNKNAGYLILNAWQANPNRYAARLASFLRSDRNRLNIGYGSVYGSNEGDPTASISRMAIGKLSPFLSDDDFLKLEETILFYTNSYERRFPRSRGKVEYLLLESLNEGRLSQKASARLEELRRKFPNADLGIPALSGSLISMVASPIPPEKTSKMNDDQWLKAMRKYDGGDGWRSSHEQLSSELEKEAFKDRERFARLCLKMTDDIKPDYFAAILDGISAQKLMSNQPLPQENSPIEMELLFRIIRRILQIPNYSFARSVSWALERARNLDIPFDLFDVLIDFALNDPDPDKDRWKKSEGNLHGGDIFQFGLNTNRGRALWAIAKLIDTKPSRFPKFKDCLEQACRDRLISVRACAFQALLMCLNPDSDFARLMLMEIAETTPEIYGSNHFSYYLNREIYTNYQEIRPIILSMLKSEDDKTIQTAANQIILADFEMKEACKDGDKIRNGSSIERAAAANIYAHNLESKNLAIRDICISHLKTYFNDESSAVQDKASLCFSYLDTDDLSYYEDLIQIYILSSSFPKGMKTLIWKFKETTKVLPDVLCELVEKTLQLKDIPYWDSYDLPKLIIRLYSHSKDQSVVERCLDLIDDMLMKGMGGVDSELSNLER